jgi:hypothetical protein
MEDMPLPSKPDPEHEHGLIGMYKKMAKHIVPQQPRMRAQATVQTGVLSARPPAWAWGMAIKQVSRSINARRAVRHGHAANLGV